MYFLWYLLIGLVAGWIASLIVKGSGSGMLVNLIVGIIGSMLGGWFSACSAGGRRDFRKPDYVGGRCDRAFVDRFAGEPAGES